MVKLRKNNVIIRAEGDLVMELKLQGYKEVQEKKKNKQNKKGE